MPSFLSDGLIFKRADLPHLMHVLDKFKKEEGQTEHRMHIDR